MTWIPLYVWNHRNSIWHHTHSFWHNNPVFITSHPLYSWQHTQSIWHQISILATSQPHYLWEDNSYVYDILLSIYDISHGVWMTRQPRCLTSHSQYMCNHTHLIDDMTPYVCMKYTHCMYDTIGTIYDITSSLDDIIPLFVCHGTQYVYDIISTIYDVITSTISYLKPILSAITTTVYVTSPTL